MQNDPPRQVDLGPQYPSRSHKYKTGCGSIYVVIARDPDDHQIRMVFANLGKAGGCSQAQTEAVCRMLTRSLRAGDDPDAIVLSLLGYDVTRQHTWELRKSPVVLTLSGERLLKTYR